MKDRTREKIEQGLIKSIPVATLARHHRVSTRTISRLQSGNPRATSGTGGVYVLENDYGVKIGISHNCESRLGELSRSSGAPILFSRIFPVYRSRYDKRDALIVESWAHWLLDQQRLRTYGEWFQLHPIEACDLVDRLIRHAPNDPPGTIDLTYVRSFWQTTDGWGPIGPFAQATRAAAPTPRIETPSAEVTPVDTQTATIGRPSKAEERRRTARFLTLAATGVRLDLAARQAGVKAERALRLVSDRDEFDAALQAMGTAA